MLMITIRQEYKLNIYVGMQRKQRNPLQPPINIH
jgi:hypothetical protein